MLKLNHLLTGFCVSIALSMVNIHAAEKLSWQDFSEAFKTAFERGDVAELERLRRNDQSGFSNLNDLGGKFAQYGAGLNKWDQMIDDARKNVAQAHRGRSNSIANNVDSTTSFPEIIKIHHDLSKHSRKLKELAKKFPEGSRQYRVLMGMSTDANKLATDTELASGFFRDENFSNQYMDPEFRGPDGYV